MGSSEGRNKALRRLDERLADVEGALARHQRRLVELQEARERLLAERALLTEVRLGEVTIPMPEETPDRVEAAGEPPGGGGGSLRERRSRLADLPREAEPVGPPEEPNRPARPDFGPGPLDPARVWEAFSAYRVARGPRVLYGFCVAEEQSSEPPEQAPATDDQGAEASPTVADQ